MTLEPTELVTKADLDDLAAVLATIAGEARATPDIVRSAPHRAAIGPLDEAAAIDPERWALTHRAWRRRQRGR